VVGRCFRGKLVSPFSPNSFVSAQSNPAPALANTLTVSGKRSINSASHWPISPPVPQNGRNMALKSPQRRSFRACMKAPRSRSAVLGRMTSNAVLNSAYVVGLYLTRSPMWRTMGRAGAGPPGGVGRDMVAMVASGVRLGTGGAGDAERGVDAGTGVLGGIGVFVGSAMPTSRQSGSKLGSRWSLGCAVRSTKRGGRAVRLWEDPRQWSGSDRSALVAVGSAVSRKRAMRHRQGGTVAMQRPR